MRTSAPPSAPGRRLRQAATLLVAAALPMGLAVVPAAPAAATPQASFDYSMPDRFGLDENGDGLIDYVAGTTDKGPRPAVDPGTWHVDLDACGSQDAQSFRWRVIDQPNSGPPVEIVSNGTGCGDYDLKAPDEGSYRVELTATYDGGITSTVVRSVIVQDWLIVSLGDSYGSGEGAPDKKIDQTQYEEFDAAWANLEAKAAALTKVQTDIAPLQDAFDKWKALDDEITAHCTPGTADWDAFKCADYRFKAFDRATILAKEAVLYGFKVTAETIADLGALLAQAVQVAHEAHGVAKQTWDNLRGKFTATWQDQRCHRSALAGSAQAALQLEQQDPRTSVTFVHLACSGASVIYGLLGRYTGVEHPEGLTNVVCNPKPGPLVPDILPPSACIPSQVDTAKELVGQREVDATYISIGGNDAHFADIVVACMLQEPCNENESVFNNPEHLAAAVCGSTAVWTGPLVVLCYAGLSQLPPLMMSAEELWTEGKDGDVKEPVDPMFAGHTKLFQALSDKLHAPYGLVPPLRSDRVFLSEYVDATLDEKLQRCGRPERGLLNIPGFTVPEFDWIATTVAPQLNANVAKAASDHRWTKVGGIYADFAGHGYCAEQNYLVRLQESFARQGNKEGTVHPNEDGYLVYAKHIVATWKAKLYNSSGNPRRPDQAPMANAGGPYVLDEGSTVQLANHSWDGDEDPMFPTWTAPAGTTLDQATALRPMLTGVDETTGTLSLTMTDTDGMTGTDTAQVEVRNVAPAVEAGGDVALVEGDELVRDVTVSDPGTTDVLTATVQYGEGGAVQVPVQDGTVALRHTYADQGERTVTVSVSDGDGGVTERSFGVDVTNAAPVTGPVVTPLEPRLIGSTIEATLSFTDAGVLDTHTATIAWGDGTPASPATVTQRPGGGDVVGTHAYAAPGTYLATVTVTDGTDAGTSTSDYVVVYDPTGGFVTGGGVLDSPAGALTSNPTATGQANFAFVSRYAKGATVPTGNTSFRFRAGDLELESTSYQWLVVSGTKAQYKGAGKVNGVDGYGFLVSAVDDAAGDTLRVKITKNDETVYDNQLGAAQDAAATQVIRGGAINIGGGKK